MPDDTYEKANMHDSKVTQITDAITTSVNDQNTPRMDGTLSVGKDGNMPFACCADSSCSGADDDGS